MNQDEELKSITKHFGIETEFMKLGEEIGELLNECYKQYYTKNKNNHIEDEFADVYVILSQIALYFDVDETKVNTIAKQKIDRTIKRINDGWYDKHR